MATNPASSRRAATVGVLAVQGDVAEHVDALRRVGAEARVVKTRAELEGVDALIIPGGESTTVMRLLERFGLAGPIVQRVRAGMPLWGTCMGMIVAAREVVDGSVPSLGLIDIAVRRNAFGRQAESAEVDLPIPQLGSPPFPAVFIRAPWVEQTGPGVEVIATRDGHPVFVRADNVMATSFHPELTNDDRVHAYFAELVKVAQRRRDAA